MTTGKINVSVENIFPLIKKFLYNDHEIFLRELVSNATDATLKLKHLTSIGEAKVEYGNPIIEVKFSKEKGVELPEETIKLVDFSPVINFKAKGKKLSSYKIKEINLKEPEEIKAARKFLSSADDEKTGLSPVELHRRAMEKLSRDNNKDFLEGDGQITFEF
jgi:hypothetical protein